MTTPAATPQDPIRLGLIPDQTGPLVVRRARERQRRAHGRGRHQRQGRPARPAARPARRGRRHRRQRRPRPRRQLVQADGRRALRRHLQLHTAGDQGPRRRRGQDALHLPRAVRGAGVRPAHLLHRPVPASRSTRYPLAHAARPARRRSTSRRPTTLAARDERAVREVVTANGGAIVGEEYFPLDHMDYGETVERIMSSGAEVVFNTIVPPGVGRSSSSSTRPASRSAAASSSARTSTRTS